MASLRDIATRIRITAKDETAGVFKSLRSRVAAVAVAITGFFSVRSFSGAIKSAAEFESQMSSVAAITRATASEMDALRKAADAAGTNTRFTATEAGQALEQLARAGLNASQSIETLPGVLSLAQGNAIGLGEAAGIITRAVRGMGLGFDQAGRVADVLAQAAAKANTTVEGLGQALSFAAPSANALGLSLENTVAIIAQFANAGIDASRAGTALNGIFAQFQDPASTFRQELARINITTNDFNVALRQLAQAGDGGNKAILSVGREAGPALRALLAQGIGALDKLEDALRNSEGAAQAAADTMDKNLDGAFRGLASAWDAVRRSLVDPLLDPIAEQVRALSERLRAAVTDGTIGRFGETIKTAFVAAASAVREFLADFDLDATIEKVQAFTQRTGEMAASIISSLSAASNYVKFFFNSIGAGINTLRAGILKVAESFAAVGSNIVFVASKIAEGFAKITFGDMSKKFSEAAAGMREEAGALWAVSEAFAESAAESFDAAAQSAEGVRESWARIVGTGDAAAGAMGAVADAAEESAKHLSLSADELDALGNGYEFVDGEARKAATGIEAASAAARKTATDLIDAEAAVNALDAAYKTLGVTSQASLNDAAEEARRAFESIRDSGVATQYDVENAFMAYSEKAIAANKGVVDWTLRAQAAAIGMKINMEGAADSVESKMASASESLRDIGDNAESAASQLKLITSEADRAAAAIKKMYEMSDRPFGGESRFSAARDGGSRSAPGGLGGIGSRLELDLRNAATSVGSRK